MLRRLALLSIAVGAVLSVAPASAQDYQAGPVVVADVRGPLDQRGIDFLAGAVRTEDAQLVVVKVDNVGVASGSLADLITTIDTSATPVVAWVGPDGAVAYGEVAQLLEHLAVVGAAQGARIGFLPQQETDRVQLSRLNGADVVIEDETSLEGVTIVQPTIGQFIAALDGMDVETKLGNVTLETATEAKLDDGTPVTVSSVEIRFLKPTLLTRFLRLGARPDAAYFFLLAGLAVAAFEFYAAGAGIAAAIAALSLFLAGYGFATLPMNWWAVVMAVVGVGLYNWDFQRHELGIRSIVGTILMIWGGLMFVGGPAQIGTNWWAVLLTVAGIMLFYLFAMTTIVRSRFGTPTIGRDYLVGSSGVAETVLEPDGVVVIDGARWRARAHRAAAIAPGSAIEVLAVEGITLQVGPQEPAE
ncbi:MAG: NfeD family protein [Acidimicrobiia bacterium]|nr:NfeD family protein [Acidimicrobiia bacterium]